MQYQPTETETSGKQLQIIFKKLKGQTCLLGGWAVYHLVNRSYEKTTGRKYVGSRDIDIGFHIDKEWTEEQLIHSEFATAIKTIEKLRFTPVGFRLVKDFNIDNGKELTPEESAKLPLHQIFQLYIDPIVDHIHTKIKTLLGFVPIDEPLLSLAFQEKLHTTQTLFGKRIMLPKPQLMLAMKLNSAPKRDKENKLIKDISDIYALLWHSDTPLSKLKDQLFSIIPEQQTKKTLQNFSEEDISKAAKTLGINAQEISQVIKQLT